MGIFLPILISLYSQGVDDIRRGLHGELDILSGLKSSFEFLVTCVYIYTTHTCTGTSISAAYVAGVMAIEFSNKLDMTPAQLKEHILKMWVGAWHGILLLFFLICFFNSSSKNKVKNVPNQTPNLLIPR